MAAANRRNPDRAWAAFGLALALVVAIPLAAVVWRALSVEDDLWSHLAATVLPRYLVNTLWIVVGVGAGTILGGVGAAWLVSVCRFPGRRIFEWALLLPLAVPAYVVAYAYAGLFDPVGPVHAALRTWLGAEGALSWYPNIRSLWGAILVLVLVLYPYVYMLARAAFLEQSVCVLEVSRTLGLSPWGSARRVALPLARPSIAVGAALALMEALNDFGAVQHFGVDTFVTAIYRVWQARGDAAGAAQLALLLILFVAALVWLERASRGRAAFMHTTIRYRPLPAYVLRGWRGVGAAAFCALPIMFGFLLPAGALGLWTLDQAGNAIDARFWRLAFNSLVLAGGAALLCVVLGGAIAYAQRRSRGSRSLRIGAAIVGLGYAVPGAVLAVGVALALGAFDRFLNGIAGTAALWLSGGVAALYFAYTVRFLPIALGAVESGFTRVTPHMDDAGRTLGHGPGGVFRRVHMPMLKGSLLTAALLVFVDVMKELPATLMLRPFNFDTLAIRTYEFAADEQLKLAAPSALAIVAVGIIPVILLSRAIARARPGAQAARSAAATLAPA
ncbi:MAG: iron ABC transporter permease [Rhodospirillaceae bacterium]|nr:iron ABC transporter permease [Rhodospirillaceae bacterium]